VWDRYWRSIRRLSQLPGMPVIDLSHAHRMGHVRNVFVDPDEAVLTGISVGPSGEFPQARVPWSQIHRIGQHAIMIRASENDGAASAHHEREDPLDMQILNGLEVLDDDGDRVGYISDIYVNPDTLAVRGYELRTSLWERWMRGWRVVPPDGILACSRDAMIVPSRHHVAARSAGPDEVLAPGRRRMYTIKIVPHGDGVVADTDHPAARSA
jgi:uncharacterized protein YrrD